MINMNMDTTDFRKLLNLFEARNPNLEYEDEPNGKKVIARLKSYNSQIYTKLAQKLARIDELESEVKYLKAAVKDEAKENVSDLFDAEDAVRTRVVETLSFIFALTKDPEETRTPKYKDILTELEKHLTPELIVVLEGLKKQMVTVTQKSPAMSVTPIKEAVGDVFSRLKQTILGWAKDYDRQLDALKAEAGM
jgi:uncharacterized protein (UPF0335 family)